METAQDISDFGTDKVVLAKYPVKKSYNILVSYKYKLKNKSSSIKIYFQKKKFLKFNYGLNVAQQERVSRSQFFHMVRLAIKIKDRLP